MSNNSNIEDVITKVKLKLMDYIKLSDLEINEHDKFLCPAHEDTNPSASVHSANGYTKWKCFTCGEGGTIYDLAMHHENLDISGDNFLKATRFLMDKFEDLKNIGGFKVKPEDVTTQNIRRINQYILDLIKDPKVNEKNKYKFTTKRGWSNETCEDLGIGTIPYKVVKDRIKERMGIDIEKEEPYDKYFMKGLFSSQGMTFTLFDHMDRPIGFTTRNMKYEEGSKTRKYMNSPDIPGVFKKEKHLYNIAKAIKESKKQRFMYILEGNADMVTAYDAGIKNSSAICGTAITEDQLHLLKSTGVSHLTFCTDQDQGGITSIKRFLNKFTYLDIGIYIDIIDLPVQEAKKDCDPDYFIKTYGADAFNKLPRRSAFEWLLIHSDFQKPEEIVEEMIPHIALIRSQAAWQDKIKALCERTGIEEEFIKEDISSYRNQEEYEMTVERQKIVQGAYHEAKSGASGALAVLQMAIEKIEKMEEEKSKSTISPDQNMMEFEVIFKGWESYDPEVGMLGWASGFKQFDEMFDGIPKSGGYIALPGLPHTGKTAYLLNVMTNALMLTEKGKNLDLSIYFMTIDDPINVVLSRMVGIICNIPMRSISKLSIQTPDIQMRIRQAQEMIKGWMSRGHLFIADAGITTNLDVGIRNMLKLRKKFPDKGNLFVLDNFHKLSPPPGLTDRSAWIKLSATIHSRTVADRFTCLSTFELNKSSYNRDRPSLADISETGSIVYDCQGIILCHSDFYVKQGDTEFKWEFGGIEHPILEANFAKNKINDFKRNLYYKFNTTTTKMFEVEDIEMAKEDGKSINSKIKENGDLEI